MKRYLLIATVVVLCSCSLFRDRYKVDKQYVTKSGLRYTIHKNGIGERPEVGEKIKIHFTGQLKDGQVFASSHKREAPVVFQLGVGQVIKAWDEFFQLVNEGTEATLEVPPNLAYGDQRMANVPPNSTLIYHLEFLEVLNPPIPFDVANKDTIFLENGLKYIRVNSTGNQKAEAFRKVTVDYTGYLENGNIFDSSVERGFPISFELGKQQVISGWDFGVQQMRVGEKFRFIVPPNLAYGEKGLLPLIEPGATLIFDIELLKIE